MPRLVVVLVALSPRLFLDQRLPVDDGDLVIVRMDFGKGQKAMAIAAIIDEGGLQRRLDARDLGEIDIAAQLFLAGGFEIKFLDAIAAQDHHPGFFRVGRIDKHFVGHDRLVRAQRARGALSPVEVSA